MWDIKRGAYRVMVGRYEKRRPLGRSRHRWEDLQEVGWEGLDWITVNEVMNFRLPRNAGSFLTSS